MGYPIGYCEICEKKVPVRKFSWFAFIVGLLFIFVGALIYLIYYYATGGYKCNICGSKVSKKPPMVVATAAKPVERRQPHEEEPLEAR